MKKSLQNQDNHSNPGFIWDVYVHYLKESPFFATKLHRPGPVQDGPAQWACRQLQALRSGRRAQVAEEV